MPITNYPPAGATAPQRDKNLEGSPTALEPGILFFLEVRALMTGLNDRVAHEERDVLERNWMYPGLPDNDQQIL
jgi:hypothetical protein